MATIREAAVELMRNLVTDPSRYYAQNTGQSWSNLTTKTVFGYNVQVPAGPMDCIGSVTAVYKALGLLNHGLYTSTRDVRVDICDGVKFILTEWLDDYVMQPGDMPLCERPQKVGHISMCTVGGPGFRIAEFVPSGGREVDCYQYNYFADGEVKQWNYCIALSDFYGDQEWAGPGNFMDPGDVSGGTVPGGGTSGGGNVENLECDGWWGSATTAALQRHYGTVVDGEVWGQWQPNVSANTALTSGWVCDAAGSGSELIRKLQEDLGTAVDGVFGGADILAFQERCGQAQTGALIGPDPSVAVMQQRLNAGTW